MKPRLAVLCDFPEERWPSMDLVSEMLLAGLSLRADFDRTCDALRVCPPFRARLGRAAGTDGTAWAHNVDRLANRLWDYPRYVRRQVAGRFDLYHVADHSYAQLVHALPAERTGVFCHDLDTFRCLLEPERDRRPRWFRAMARHILRGMQKASVVFYSTEPVREQMLLHGLVDPGRLVHAPYGISHEFSPNVGVPEPAAALLAEWHRLRPFVLHVGSCIPRKRIDVLLNVFAALRDRRPELHLVQVGGEWTDAQREQLDKLALGSDVTQLRGLSRVQIASLYRTAGVVLQPSEAEGFGLPVIEALACGAAVVASDIPVLREVGGAAATYRTVGEVAGWAEAVSGVLDDPMGGPVPVAARLAWASRYSWAAHAQNVSEAYLRLLDERPAAVARVGGGNNANGG